MSEYFSRENAVGKILVEWCKGLDNDRASRAILRRAASPTEVALSAPYQRLFRRLREAHWNPDGKPYLNDRLAAAVGLLAHVRDDIPDLTPAKAMGKKKEGAAEDRPPVSEPRFLRLLDAPDIAGLYDGLRRVLPLMEHKVDVLRLTNDLLSWNDETRKRWAYAYYEWLARSNA